VAASAVRDERDIAPGPLAVDVTGDGCADLVYDGATGNDRKFDHADVPECVDHVTDDRAIGDSLRARRVFAHAFAARSRRDHHDSLARHGDSTR
jgi:hypothetical protein